MASFSTTASPQLERLLTRLDGVQRYGRGFMARCPVHDDRTPSLSINQADGGRILLHCWAGCETTAVLAALGLTWSDLFPLRAAGRRRKPGWR